MERTAELRRTGETEDVLQKIENSPPKNAKLKHRQTTRRRTKMFQKSIIENNPATDKLVLFKKTQKLLDRILFVHLNYLGVPA